MRILGHSLVFALALAALPARAATEASIVTIAEGDARVLRGAVWYRVVAGAPFQDGDVIQAGQRTTVQVELGAGGTLNLVGPGALYAAALPAAGGKEPLEFGMVEGWLKYAAAAPGAGARVRTPVAVVAVNEGIVVVHHDDRLFEMFVETGSARLAETGRPGRDGPWSDARAGQYWSRDGDGAFVTERRAPVKFVASMPRHQIDNLATLAPRFKGQRPALVAEREITLAEADPWLAGPYRRAFVRRLHGRLADPAFRRDVEAKIAAYPEFDRVLHPEKFAPNPAAAAAGAAPAGALPSAGATDGKVAPAPGTGSKPPPPATPLSPRSGPRGALLQWSPLLSLILPKAPETFL